MANIRPEYAIVTTRLASATDLVVTRDSSATDTESMWIESIENPPNLYTTRDSFYIPNDEALGDKRSIQVKAETIILNGQEIEVSKLLKAYTTMSNRLDQLDRIEANQKKIKELLERAIEAGTVPNLQETLR